MNPIEAISPLLSVRSPMLSSAVFATVISFLTATGSKADTTGYPGVIEAVDRADVYSRAEGIVEDLLVVQGEYVSEGTPLVQLKDDLQELSVEAAAASLAKVEALLAKAQQELQRAQRLSSSGTRSDVAVSDAQFALLLAQADRDLAETALKVAQLHLDDTTIRAPISGYVEDPRVGRGSLVEFNSGDPPMLELVGLDTVRVVFEVPYQDWEAWRHSEAFLDGSKDTSPRFLVNMAGSDVVRTELTPSGSAVWIDETLSTIRVWAEVPNPDRALLPGMRLNVIPVSESHSNPSSSPDSKNAQRYIPATRSKP